MPHCLELVGPCEADGARFLVHDGCWAMTILIGCQLSRFDVGEHKPSGELPDGTLIYLALLRHAAAV